MALPALACKWFLDTEDEWFHDDPYDTDDPSISWALDEPEPSPADMLTHTDIFRGGSDAAAGKGGLVCASATEADMPTHTDIFHGGSDADVVPAARRAGTVHTLRAMSCQLDNMNRLLRDAEYDNAEF